MNVKFINFGAFKPKISYFKVPCYKKKPCTKFPDFKISFRNFDITSQKFLNPTVSRIKYDLLYTPPQKSTFSSLPTEKRFKIKPKPWEYDATELVKKILEAKETNTDENNNSANDNHD